jgi:hypothetical protein
MVTDDKVQAVNTAMAAARAEFGATLQAADEELTAALAQYSAGNDATANWNLIEAHNRHRNAIEAAAFKLRLAFLKCAGRRE